MCGRLQKLELCNQDTAEFGIFELGSVQVTKLLVIEDRLWVDFEANCVIHDVFVDLCDFRNFAAVDSIQQQLAEG